MGILNFIKTIFSKPKEEEKFVTLQPKPRIIEPQMPEPEPKQDRFKTAPAKRMSREELRQYFPELFD